MNVDVHTYSPVDVSGGQGDAISGDSGLALFHAACVGNVEAVHAVMSSGYCDVDQYDKTGRTALHWAVERGHEGVVEVLVTAYHASVDVVSFESESPLLLAVVTGRLAIVKQLLSYGAQTQHTNRDGASALHLAAGLGLSDIVLELIHQGAWIELEDGEGESPLFYAIRESHLPVVRSLLEAGASAAHPNNDQDTPLSLAHECCNPHDSTSATILQLLSTHTAPAPQRQNLLEPFTRVESRSFGSSSGNLCGFLTKTI